MPSTYSTRLRLELQATGENQTTWGEKANAVFSRLDDAIAGVVSINLGTSLSSTYTLSAANGSYDEARGAALKLSGQLASAVQIALPAVEKNYWIYNGTSGSTPRIGPTGGTTVSLQAGWTKIVTDGSATWIAVEPLSLTTYLSDSSAALKYAQLSANQTLTGNNTISGTLTVSGAISASAATFSGPLSVSSLNATSKISAGSLYATTISATNLVAVSLSVDNIGGTNAYFTSVSSSAIYAKAMYISGSVVLTSALLPAAGGSGITSVAVSSYGGYVSLVAGTSTSSTALEIKVNTIRAYSSTGSDTVQQLGDVSITCTLNGNVVEIQLIKRLYNAGGGA